MKDLKLNEIAFAKFVNKVDEFGKKYPAALFIFPLALCLAVTWVNLHFPDFNDTIELQFAAIVIITAWLSGLLMSLIVAATSVVFMDRLFLDPSNHLHQDIIFLAVFIPASIVMSSIVSGQRRAFETYSNLALYDSLTGLPNRRLLKEKINIIFEMAKRNHAELAIVFIDVDNFKNINDTHGHWIGDRVLQQTAKNLQSNSRSEDIVARYGGDEFVMVINSASREEISQIIERIIASFNNQFVFGEVTTDLSISMGIAFYPDHGDSCEEVMQQADLALYKAKEIKQSSFIFAPEREKSL